MEKILSIVLPAVPETLIMIGISSLIGIAGALPLGIILYITKKGGLSENLRVYRILDMIINVLRSLPFVVLMLVLFPLTKLLVGKRIGLEASIVPLSFSAIPFLARLLEGNFNEVDKGIIEAAKAMGTDSMSIVKKVVLKESLPQVISSLTITIINLIGLSAIVGIIGGGGLGDVAIRYGYQRNQTDILWVSCLAIIFLVQIVQIVGNNLSKKINKK